MRHVYSKSILGCIRVYFHNQHCELREVSPGQTRRVKEVNVPAPKLVAIRLYHAHHHLHLLRLLDPISFTTACSLGALVRPDVKVDEQEQVRSEQTGTEECCRFGTRAIVNKEPVGDPATVYHALPN